MGLFLSQKVYTMPRRKRKEKYVRPEPGESFIVPNFPKFFVYTKLPNRKYTRMGIEVTELIEWEVLLCNAFDANYTEYKNGGIFIYEYHSNMARPISSPDKPFEIDWDAVNEYIDECCRQNPLVREVFTHEENRQAVEEMGGSIEDFDNIPFHRMYDIKKQLTAIEA